MNMTSGSGERFTALFATVTSQEQPVVIADAKEGAPIDVSLAGAQDIGPDNTRHLGYRALSMLSITKIDNPTSGVVGRIRETIEVYRDPAGKLTACFGDSVIAASTIGSTILAHPHHEYSIPPQSADIAVSSALLAMEQALQVQA